MESLNSQYSVSMQCKCFGREQVAKGCLDNNIYWLRAISSNEKIPLRFEMMTMAPVTYTVSKHC